MRIKARRSFWLSPSLNILAVVLFSFINMDIAESAPPIKPSTPTDLSITNDSGSYTVSWVDDTALSTAYELRWQILDGGHWRWLSHGQLIENADTRTWVLQRAIADEVLRFSIRALNGKSKSRWSAWVIAENVPQNNPPTANAGADQSVVSGRRVMLDGTASSDPDGDSLVYAWQITQRPLNSQSVLTMASTATPEYIADMAGEYHVELVVSDSVASSVADTVIVDAVANTRPFAVVGNDLEAAPGQLITLDGTQSYDDNGDTLTYHWSLLEKPADSQAVLSAPASSSPAFTVDLSGQYVVQLIVNDGSVDSDPVTVTVSASSLKLTVDSPQDQTVTSRPFIIVSGTVEDADPANKNIGVVINYNQLAVIDRSKSPMTYLARIPLLPGEQAINISATSQLGEVASETLSVTRNAGSAYDVDITPASGNSPLDVDLKLSVDDPYNNVLVQVMVDFNNDGYDDFAYDGIEYTPEGNIIVHPMNPAQEIAFTYSDPGIYQAKVKVLDYIQLNNHGVSATEHTIPVEVIDENADLSLFSAIWEGMNNAVLAGNIDAAATAFTRGSRKKFVPLLTALQPHYQEISDSYSEWLVTTNTPGYKEFVLSRIRNGESRTYFITFIQDHAGVWRIISM